MLPHTNVIIHDIKGNLLAPLREKLQTAKGLNISNFEEQKNIQSEIDRNSKEIDDKRANSFGSKPTNNLNIHNTEETERRRDIEKEANDERMRREREEAQVTADQKNLENMKNPDVILEDYKPKVYNKYKVENLPPPANKPIIKHFFEAYSDNIKSFNEKTDSYYKQIKTEFYKELKYNKKLIEKYRTEEKTYSEKGDYGRENDDTIIDNLLHQLDEYYKNIKGEVLESINVDTTKIQEIINSMNLDINKSTIGGKKINKRKSKKNKKKNNKKNRSVKKNKSKKSRK